MTDFYGPRPQPRQPRRVPRNFGTFESEGSARAPSPPGREHGDRPAPTVARRWHVCGLLLLTAAGIGALIEAWRLGLWRQNSPGEGLFPFLAAVAVTGLALFGLVSAARMAEPSRAASSTDEQGATIKRIAWYLIGLGFYVGAIEPLGIAVSTVLVVALILRFAERHSVLESLGIAIATAVGCELIVALWPGAGLPRGWLWDRLRH